jgi:LacI family transcriptional regulator
MKDARDSKVLLLLPLFFEFARRVRLGVLDWIDRNPGWHVIELDPATFSMSEEFSRHVDGVIGWVFPDQPVWQEIVELGCPLIDCGSDERAAKLPVKPAGVTFDRASINRLAARHFEEIGLEVAGYLGAALWSGGKRMPRVEGFRQEVLDLGMEWLEFDLESLDPYAEPEWLWEGAGDERLAGFIREMPKPAGIFAQDDYFAAMLCESVRRLGFRVPDDIAILGQGDRTVASTGILPVSSVALPGERIGWEAAARMERWIRGKRPKPWRTTVDCTEIAVRESTGGPAGDLRVERARRYLERHHLTGVTVGQLATVAGCSEKTLKSRFKSLCGIELASWIRERRRDEAESLLGETDLAVAEIGRRIGFDSPSNFFNFFRRQSGKGPVEYRAGKASGSASSVRASTSTAPS